MTDRSFGSACWPAPGPTGPGGSERAAAAGSACAVSLAGAGAADWAGTVGPVAGVTVMGAGGGFICGALLAVAPPRPAFRGRRAVAELSGLGGDGALMASVSWPAPPWPMSVAAAGALTAWPVAGALVAGESVCPVALLGRLMIASARASGCASRSHRSLASCSIPGGPATWVSAASPARGFEFLNAAATSKRGELSALMSAAGSGSCLGAESLRRSRSPAGGSGGPGRSAAGRSSGSFSPPGVAGPSTAAWAPGVRLVGVAGGVGASGCAPRAPLGTLAVPAGGGFGPPAVWPPTGGGEPVPVGALAVPAGAGFGLPAVCPLAAEGWSSSASTFAFPASGSFEAPASGGGPSSAGALATSGGRSEALTVRSSAAEGWSTEVGASALPRLSALGPVISFMTLPAQLAQQPPRVLGAARGLRPGVVGRAG